MRKTGGPAWQAESTEGLLALLYAPNDKAHTQEALVFGMLQSA